MEEMQNESNLLSQLYRKQTLIKCPKVHTHSISLFTEESAHLFLLSGHILKDDFVSSHHRSLNLMAKK